MVRSWMLGGAAVAVVAMVGVLGWNERRLKACRHVPLPMQQECSEPIEFFSLGVLQAETPAIPPEEPIEVDVIDLAVLLQTTEPPMAGFEVPAGLPITVDMPSLMPSRIAPPTQVADYLPHSADGQVAAQTTALTMLWKRLTSFFFGRQEAEVEALPVFPRPTTSTYQFHESCPYDGGHYRHAVKRLVGSGDESTTSRKP